MLIKILKQHNMKAWELANILQVHISQIYKWDKNGISENNPHAAKIKALLPEYEFNPESKRSNAGRPKKELTFTGEEIPSPPEERPRPTTFPRIIFKKK